jgi:dihydropteroate synthase
MIKCLAILNTSPDSFSDGGNYDTLDKALEHAKKLIAEGADILDIGGEASGPDSPNINLNIELERTIPLIQGIRQFSQIPISIDTYKAEVAEQALAVGANIINDVTALRGDPEMAKIAAAHQCQTIIMYSKDPSARTTRAARDYADVIQTIGDFLEERIQYAIGQGIKVENLILDPGLGHFISAKPQYSYEIILRLPELKKRFPQHKFLLGISRKSFLGGDLQSRDERGVPLQALAALNGADYLRTHAKIKELKDFLNSLAL